MNGSFEIPRDNCFQLVFIGRNGWGRGINGKLPIAAGHKEKHLLLITNCYIVRCWYWFAITIDCWLSFRINFLFDFGNWWCLETKKVARRLIEMVERDKLNWNLDAVHDCSAIDLKVATHYKTGRIPFFSPQQSILLHVVWYLSFLELFFALIKACLAFHTDSFL